MFSLISSDSYNNMIYLTIASVLHADEIVVMNYDSVTLERFNLQLDGTDSLLSVSSITMNYHGHVLLTSPDHVGQVHFLPGGHVRYVPIIHQGAHFVVYGPDECVICGQENGLIQLYRTVPLENESKYRISCLNLYCINRFSQILNVFSTPA